jgi:histidine triad (HIT) family protein
LHPWTQRPRLCNLKLMTDSIFTKIIKGDIPCSKVYEDELVIAFMDIHPIQPGHLLVVPKVQVANFEELDEQTYTHLFLVVKQAAQRLKQVLSPAKVCIRVEGFDVPHTHVHVYPCNDPADFYGKSDRLTQEPDFAALAEMADKLVF